MIVLKDDFEGKVEEWQSKQDWGNVQKRQPRAMVKVLKECGLENSKQTKESGKVHCRLGSSEEKFYRKCRRKLERNERKWTNVVKKIN